MPGMAGRAVSDRSVRIGPADAVALLASAGHGGSALNLHKRMRWTPGSSRLVHFREVHLFGREPLLAVYGGPRRRSVPAVQELLVDILVAAAAVPRGQLGGNDESVMIFLLLPRRWLMAIQAVHAFLRVHAHLIFVDDGVLSPYVAFRTFSSGTNQSRTRLLGFYFRARAIDKECGENQSECDHDGDEDRAKRHAKPSTQKSLVVRGATVWRTYFNRKLGGLYDALLKREILASVVQNGQEEHCANARNDEHTSERKSAPEQESFEPVQLRTRNRHKRLL